MKNYLLYIAIVFSVTNCSQKETAAKQKKSSNAIVIGQIDSIYSKTLNESRKIWVHIPESARNRTSNNIKYPVLYLLDGDGHFFSVTGMIKQLSTTNGNTITPEMIVIGIPNTDRTRDLTPTHVKEIFGDTIFPKTSGGGKKFLSFIEKELIPYVEKTYPASNYRTLIGHSLGGLAVIDALVDSPNLFNNYVAIDPSLWYDDQELLKRAKSVLNTNTFSDRSLYVGVANTMHKGMDFTQVEKDSSEITYHIRSILQFVKAMDAFKVNGLNFKWKYYDNENHASVPLIAEYDAFRFLFPWYELKGIDQFFDPSSTTTTDDLMNVIGSHYNNVSKNFGYEVLPPEQFINSLAYGFMNNGMLDKACSLFDLNIKNYPRNSNVYDSKGDCFLAQKDSIKALEYYNKALEVGDNDYSQEKINKLKEDLKD